MPSTSDASAQWGATTLEAAHFSQEARLLSLQLPEGNSAAQAGLTVERLDGTEAVNGLFHFAIDVLVSAVDFDATALIGDELTLRLLLADGSHRAWHGILVGCDAMGGDGGLARLRLHLQPWLSHLALRRDSYVFARQTVQDIVREVFADYPLAHYAFEVNQDLPVYPTRVQYRESDLEFIQRILAAEGLNYRFEHQQDDAAASSEPAPSRHRLVIFDRQATLPDNRQSPIRFHRVDATETDDSMTGWHARRQVVPNAVTLSAWDATSLFATNADLPSGLDLGDLPPLEHHDGAGAQRYASGASARDAVERQLLAFEAQAKRYEGEGTARTLAAGQVFALREHDRYGEEAGDRRYVATVVHHEAANNLGAQAADVLETSELERGSYRNRVEAQDVAALLVPTPIAKPTAPEAMIALVVGEADNVPDAAGADASASATQPGPASSVHTQRDHRVQVRFHWQARQAARATQDTDPTSRIKGSGAHDALLEAGRRSSHAASVWLRVATPVAGPNWGAHLLPRVGTEVLIAFIDGDIDRPVVAQQLFNAQDLPPWSAGTDSQANHPGVLSGWHSRGLDGAGYNQWMTDDAAGQVRTRLASSQAASQLNLGHLNEQLPDSPVRGNWRGTGAELRSDAWVVTRAGDGLLISTTLQERAQGPVQTTTETQGQLLAAKEAAEKVSTAITESQGLPFKANALLQPLLDDLDPTKNGHYPASVNGQDALVPPPGKREGGDPAPAFARPLMVLDAASNLNAATPASIAVFGGEAVHWTSQQQAHIAGGQTVSMASGGSAGLFVQQGGLQVMAQEGPVSVQAHAGKLAWNAQEAFTVTSTDGIVDVLAATKVTLTGGNTSITLDGANIVLKMPGLLDIKGSAKSFVGPGGTPAAMPSLPVDLAKIKPDDMLLDYRHSDGLAVQGAPYEVTFADGSTRSGTLDSDGKALLTGVPKGSAKVHYGEDVRRAPEGEDDPNPLAGWI